MFGCVAYRYAQKKVVKKKVHSELPTINNKNLEINTYTNYSSNHHLYRDTLHRRSPSSSKMNDTFV